VPPRPPNSDADALPRWVDTATAARILGVGRTTIDAMVSDAPKDLPGGPVHVGRGGVRRHLRWDLSRIGDWVDAYRAWEASGKRRRAAPQPRPEHGERLPRPKKAVEDGPRKRRSLLSIIRDESA